MIDVLVVGAGPAGCVAAIVLARAGARVLMVDRGRFPRAKLCGDSLNPGTLALLARLGLRDLPQAGGTPVHGMIVTNEQGATVTAQYPPGIAGRIISRYHLDAWLLEQAIAAGVCFRSDVRVVGVCGDDGVAGVVASEGQGQPHELRARLTIAADGRRSTLAFRLGLVHHPGSPRRWAIGGYLENFTGLTSFGEMHIRRRQYIGVAPLPGGLANVCVVTSDRRALSSARDLGTWLKTQVRNDPALSPRAIAARLVAPPMSLGPLAVDAHAAGAPGLLLAGDAAGFIDPMTGDGLYFAMRGAELAAEAALTALNDGRRDAHQQLLRARRSAFARKQRFNRTLRSLVDHPRAVGIASAASRAWPSMVRRIVQYAGDVNRC